MMFVRDYPQWTLLCLTVIMPGSVKRDSRSLAVAEAALEALKADLEGVIREQLVRDLPTGYEAYLLVDLPLLEAKRRACAIEDTHPLGRLFDIDVINDMASPVSRAAIGQEPRRCLLCGREVRYCMRNRSHSTEELQTRISQMIDEYVHRL